MQQFISYMMDKVLMFIVSDYFMYAAGLAICVGILNLVYIFCTSGKRR